MKAVLGPIGVDPNPGQPKEKDKKLLLRELFDYISEQSAPDAQGLGSLLSSLFGQSQVRGGR